MPKRIYVGNLPFDATTEQVTQLFEQYGELRSVNLVSDRETGRPRGFGFVEFADEAACDKAISALDGVAFGGRNLKVNEARPRTERPRGGGGSGPRW